jgi:UDP-N-acetylglucosamine acyltransferase
MRTRAAPERRVLTYTEPTCCMGVHPTAIVDPGAELGPDVDIGPWTLIGPRVRLGDRTRVHAHAVIDGDTWLGTDCEVFPFAVVGTMPQDKKLKGGEAPGRLRIGSHNRIREHATIHGGTVHGTGVTTIGDHNMLLVGCHIGHDATVGSHVVFTNGAMAAGHTVIGDRAILGAMVGVHQFARVGTLAMIGAGAMLSHDAPPFALVQGDRARLIGVNLVGLQRNGHGAQAAAVVKRVYRLLFWRPGNLVEKMESIRSTALGRDEHCRVILDFVASSRRGVCMPRDRRAGGGEGREAADAGKA